jgi:hypothetical protein
VKEEATEGEVGLVAKGLQRTSGLSVREPGLWGKHRTEVTEATEEEGMEGCRGRVRLRPNRDVEWWSGGGWIVPRHRHRPSRTPPRRRPWSSFADRAGLLG